MNLNTTIPLMLTLVIVPLSGCISADEFYDEMQAQYESWESDHENENWEHEEDEWEEDCPEEEWNEAHDHEHDHEDEDDADFESREIRKEDIEDAFEDADPRFSNILDGEEDSRRTIDVDWGDDELRVGLIHSFDGEVEIQLRNPLGFIVAEEEFDGEKEMNEESWYVKEDPMPGDWRLSIEIDGEGGYAVGFYLDD